MAEKTKTPSIKDVMKKINSMNKEWNILGSGVFSQNLRKLPFKALGFDLPFKGGLPYGQIVTFSGVEHSGKSTAAAIAMARYQQENPGKVCIWVDAENTLLTQAEYFMSITGIKYDEDCFLRYDCTGRSAEEIFQDLIELQSTPEIGLIVIDSARALISQADLDNDFTKDNGQRASVAKPMGKFIKQMMMYLPKRDNILLIINQVTVEKDMFSTRYIEPCGYALKYFPSLKVRFGTRTFTAKTKTDISQSKVDDSVDGLQLHFAIVKSRLGGMNKDGGFITIRYNGGVDTVFDLIEVGMPAKFIQCSNGKECTLVNLNTGVVYTDKETGKELIFTGEKAMQNYLESHPDFVDEYYDMIMKYISKSKVSVDLLDKDIMQELLAQEAATCGDEMTPAQALAADGVEDE